MCCQPPGLLLKPLIDANITHEKQFVKESVPEAMMKL